VKPRVYLSGPMTGYVDHNHTHFMLVKEQWEEWGWEVVTPFDANAAVWAAEHDGEAFDPAKHVVKYNDPILRRMFAADVAALLTCNAIALLDGWQSSAGASTELHVARLFSVPAFNEHGRAINPRTIGRASPGMPGPQRASAILRGFKTGDAVEAFIRSHKPEVLE
jgi:Domain of unknown function (DUF4406)